MEIDPKYFRPTEVVFLQADITKARQKLGWEPRVGFNDLVKIMVDYDARLAGIEAPGEGIRTAVCQGFTYTNHDFAFYENIRERC